jgi:hypothetical protein
LLRRRQQQQEQDHCNGLPPELPPTRLVMSFALKINSCNSNNNSNNNESIPKKEEHYPRVVPPRVLGNRPNSPLLITMVAPAVMPAMAVVCATEKN